MTPFPYITVHTAVYEEKESELVFRVQLSELEFIDVKPPRTSLFQWMRDIAGYLGVIEMERGRRNAGGHGEPGPD